MFINLSFNNIKSNNIFKDICKSQIDRGIILGEYNSYFCRYLGVDNVNEYNNNLARINKEEKEYVKFQELPLSIGTNSIIEEKIKVHGIEFYRYISISEDNSLNFKIYKALDFINEYLNKNFMEDKEILDLLKFIASSSFEFIKDKIWDDNNTNKVIFYGSSSKKEAYLMLFLKLLGMDILYLSPEGNDIDKYIYNIEDYSFFIKERINLEFVPLKERLNSGKVISEFKTIGKEAEGEIEKEIFNDNTGFYKPWQFIDYNVNSIFLNSTFEEIMIYYNEDAKVRPGFKVSNEVVSIPSFLAVITGVLDDKERFGEFLRLIFNKESTLVLNNLALYNYPIGYEEALSYKECFNENGKVSKEKINFHVAGNRFKKYRESLKDLFVNKINEIFEHEYIINAKFNESSKIEYLATIMTMPEEFYQLIDSFDFTGKVPKITIYRDNNQQLEIRELYVLMFLKSIGVDIILYSSFGTYGIEKWTNKNFITYHRLENVEYNFNLEEALKVYKKRGFLSRLFKK
ncbi:YceG family protein [Clostridium sp.]|uniref:YceG family protein n=1 Tax=Clostridium sp. TaxID=1506 RepID=UPI0039935246